MKIRLLFFCILFALLTKAQITYNFTALAGVYTPNSAGTQTIGPSVDDATTTNIILPFTFNFGCTNYTRIRVNSNGFLTFNTTFSGTGFTNGLATTLGMRPCLAPLWDDLSTDATGNVNWQTTGTTPNRVVTVEWRNMRWSLSAAGPVISFQVKLYETTNRVEFVYSQNATAVTCDGASIGIAGINSGDFYSLNNSGASPTASKLLETTNICTKPATGQIYRWDPVSCSGAPTAGNAVATPSTYCTSYNSTLTLSGNTQGCGITYQWYSAPAIGGPYTSIAGATLATRAVTVSATTFYQCVITCTSAGISATTTPATATITPSGACPLCSIRQISSLPYTHNGQTTCGEINDITSTSASQICGNSSYYGGEDVVYSFTPTATGATTINVTTPNSFLGITLYQGCPIAGGTCVGASQTAGTNATLCANVTAGQTYYLVIDSWPSPNCIGFDLNISAVGPCAGSISGAVAAATATSGCSPVNSVFSLSGVSACGATYQWQAAPAAVGPYTNIIGATNVTYNATLTSSAFYRCLLTCGASTAASTVIQTTITPAPVVPCALSTYTAGSVGYNFEAFVGTVLPTTDDILFNTIVNLGFQFCYGGGSYWGGYAASNGAFVLDCVPCYPNIGNATCASGGLGTGFTMPSPAPVFGTSIPRNAILAPWQDIHPGLGGTIRYYTAGVAPNRRFVLSYESIPMFSCGTSSPSIYFTGQIKLFETSNAIEIHVGNKGVCPGFNNGEAVMGLHSYDGAIYIPPVNATAHNAVGGAGPYNQWNMTNTAYRFQSPCAVNSGPCVVLPIAFKNFYGENISSINKLTWETAEESGIREFSIERSTDGINFVQIGIQNPNDKASTYIYNDNTFKSNMVNYYRITAIESNFDRKSTYIIPIGSSSDDLTVSEVFPNPTKNNFSIGFTSKKENNFIVKIKDIYGRDIKISNHHVNAGVSQININCESFSSGVYFIEVLDSSQRTLSQQKLIITN